MIVRLSGKCELAGSARNLPNMVAKSIKVSTKQTGGLIMSRADRLCENRSALRRKRTNKWGLGRDVGQWGEGRGNVRDARGHGRHGD